LYSKWRRKEACARGTIPAAEGREALLNMSLSRAEVEKIALLSRLLLSAEELERMTVQLGDILGYMDLLAEVDTTGIQPMAHAREMANVFREDGVRPSLDRQQALANSPHRDEECYLVPAVL
jgi:aspartyl-tRNA(Asn)/glutamyl-tRNA(Gln) amidotransferase subunit C